MDHQLERLREMTCPVCSVTLGWIGDHETRVMHCSQCDYSYRFYRNLVWPHCPGAEKPKGCSCGLCGR